MVEYLILQLGPLPDSASKSPIMTFSRKHLERRVSAENVRAAAVARLGLTVPLTSINYSPSTTHTLLPNCSFFLHFRSSQVGGSRSAMCHYKAVGCTNSEWNITHIPLRSPVWGCIISEGHWFYLIFKWWNYKNASTLLRAHRLPAHGFSNAEYTPSLAFA